MKIWPINIYLKSSKVTLAALRSKWYYCWCLLIICCCSNFCFAFILLRMRNLVVLLKLFSRCRVAVSASVSPPLANSGSFPSVHSSLRKGWPLGAPLLGSSPSVHPSLRDRWTLGTPLLGSLLLWMYHHNLIKLTHFDETKKRAHDSQKVPAKEELKLSHSTPS